MAERKLIQDAANVAITGGSITGITDLAIADGGTGSSTAAAARTALGVSPQWRHPTLMPTGAIAETYPGHLATTSGAVNTGFVRLVQIFLPIGTLCTSITFVSVTALSGITLQKFGLYDSSYNLLRATNDDGSTAWGANTHKTLNLTSTFTTTYTGLHYVAMLVNASGIGTHVTTPAITPVPIYDSLPYIAFRHGSGSLTDLPNPVTSPAAQNLVLYGYIK